MSNKNEVLELEAEEVSNNPLEATIEKELIKHNVTDAVINSLKQKYGNLKLSSIDNKQDYLEITEARKEVRRVGILVEKLCKKGREEAVAIQKKWLSKEKETLDKIAVVQTPLDAEIKKFDDEVERKEQEEKKRQEEAFIKRQSELLKYGARYEGGSYILNHISYESINIQEADEEVYTDIILPKYKQQFEKNESVRVEEENKRAAEIEKLRIEKEAFEKQQSDFKAQQEAFNKQKEEQERSQRDEQIRRESEERIRREGEIKRRCNQLSSLGMKFNFQYDAYTFEDVNVDNKTEISLLSNEDWDALINKITPVIEQRKKDAEEKRLTQVEKEKQEAIEAAATKERLRIEEQTRQETIKKEQEEKQRIEDAAKASDKQKWSTLISQLEALRIPEFNSTIYKGKLAIFNSFVEKMKSL